MTLLDLSSVRDSPIAPTTWEGTFSIPQGWEQEYVPLNRLPSTHCATVL